MNKIISPKENVMKTLAILLVGVLSVAVFAQSPSYVEKGYWNYVQALKSDNDGLVEAGIFYSVKFSLFYPERNTDNMVQELTQLVHQGRTDTIRYKAFLALEYFRSKDLQNRIVKADYKDANEFFKMLNQEINRQALAANN
jgi:hypothetical protein